MSSVWKFWVCRIFCSKDAIEFIGISSDKTFQQNFLLLLLFLMKLANPSSWIILGRICTRNLLISRISYTSLWAKTPEKCYMIWVICWLYTYLKKLLLNVEIFFYTPEKKFAIAQTVHSPKLHFFPRCSSL